MPDSLARTDADHRLDPLLLGLVDVALAGAILAVPLLMGGRHPVGQLALVAMAVAAGVCWCLRQSLSSRGSWRRSPADLLLLAAPALVALQLVELPPWLLATLSPRLSEVLPLWSPHDHGAPSLGVWNTLSLTPAATRRCLTILTALALLAGVTLQRVRNLEDVERLVRWIAYSASVAAIFGLVQYFTSNGKFFWFYEHPFSHTNNVVKGSFTNANHFAHFIALGIGPLIWWILSAAAGRSGRRGREPFGFSAHAPTADTRVGLAAVALAVVVFAGLMSCSRGGAMAIVAAATVALFVLYCGRLIRPKTLLGGVGVGAFILACLSIYGYEPVAAELDDFGSVTSLDRSGVRRRLWAANLQGLADFPLAGTGAGSHRDVIPMYFRDPRMNRLEFTHAENSYAQVGLESGVPGALVMLTGVGLCVFWCGALMFRSLPARAVLALAAVASGLSASFIHAAADFVWYVPGCSVLVVILAACAFRLWQFAGQNADGNQRWWSAPRAVWLGAAVCLVITGGFMLENRFAAVRAEHAWHRYVLLNQWLHTGSTAKPDPAELSTLAGHLTDATRWQPSRGRAHARLAEIHLALFEAADDSPTAPFTVKQVRDAALASRFDSSAALCEWLDRAFPDRWHHLETAWRHARAAVCHAPLEAEGYLRLADVSFFDGPDLPAKSDYIAQALLVRPFDGDVLYEAGREAVLAGDWDGAFQRWKASYRSGPDAQKRLEEFLAGKLPAAAFIEVFQPDLLALRRMHAHYAGLDRPNERRTVLERYAAVAEGHARSLTGPKAADAWLEAAYVFQKLEKPDERLRCLRTAVACGPGQYDARHALAQCLFQMGQYPEAEEHLKWCAQWKPQDKSLRAELEAAMDQRLRVSSRPEKELGR